MKEGGEVIHKPFVMGVNASGITRLSNTRRLFDTTAVVEHMDILGLHNMTATVTPVWCQYLSSASASERRCGDRGDCGQVCAACVSAWAADLQSVAALPCAVTCPRFPSASLRQSMTHRCYLVRMMRACARMVLDSLARHLRRCVVVQHACAAAGDAVTVPVPKPK